MGFRPHAGDDGGHEADHRVEECHAQKAVLLPFQFHAAIRLVKHQRAGRGGEDPDHVAKARATRRDVDPLDIDEGSLSEAAARIVPSPAATSCALKTPSKLPSFTSVRISADM